MLECTVNADCDDGLFCNGSETCNAGSCQAGSAPNCDDAVGCTDDSCNENTDSCDNTPDCDDGVSCTDDSCNVGTDSCDNVPNDDDDDGDGVCVDVDLCPDTVVPEANVPSRRLGINRWALWDDDSIFDTTPPKGKGPRRSYSTEDTAGCSCEQIIENLGLGKGHLKYGCSIGAMDTWVEFAGSDP